MTSFLQSQTYDLSKITSVFFFLFLAVRAGWTCRDKAVFMI